MEDRIEGNVVEIEKARTVPVAPTSIFDFGSNIDRAWKFSDTLAKSAIIPDTFRGNTASCLIALDMASRMKRNPLEVMQALFIVHGKPSFSSSFLIALINSCGYYEPLRFQFSGEGETRACFAWTVDKRTGEKVEGPEISIEMARIEGWLNRSGSKWKTMPEVMLRYRAAAFFSRLYCPDLVGGFHTTEEAQETQETQESAALTELTSERASLQDLQSEMLASKSKQPAASLPKPLPAPAPAPVKEPAPKKTKTEAQQQPPEPGDFPFGDEAPVHELSAAEKEAVNKASASEAEETLREKVEVLLLHHMGLTKNEADEWCLKNYGRKRSELSKRELEITITRANAELDARDGVAPSKLF
jgi:hypothetical protein